MIEINNTKEVKKGRSDKTCYVCRKVIPKGTPHHVHDYYNDEYTHCATHKECSPKLLEALENPNH